MEFHTYQRKLLNFEAEKSELLARLRELEKNLEEAVAAKQSAIKLQEEFETFVSRKKKMKSRPIKNPLLKAFKSFAKRAESLLTGDSYWKTNDKVAEMRRVAERKITRYKDDIEYCKAELRRLERAQNALTAEYNAEKARQEAQQS